MVYDDLKEGMRLICNQSNGEQKEMTVVRKGIDGFGMESVVFQLPSGGQIYCRANEVPNWYIEPLY